MEICSDSLNQFDIFPAVKTFLLQISKLVFSLLGYDIGSKFSHLKFFKIQNFATECVRDLERTYNIVINIIRTRFSYESRFSSYVLALLKNSYKKRALIRLMKLTTGFPQNSR